MNLIVVRLTVARLTLVLLVALCAPSAFAGTIRVPADYLTIQGAISAAQDGDTVLVARGRYVETIDFLGKKILVLSEEGPEVTTIDANAQGSVVSFARGENHASVLRGFRLTGGSGTLRLLDVYGSRFVGGGVYCSGASPVIKNCHFATNDEIDVLGRDIFCGRNSAPQLIACRFRDNGFHTIQARCLFIQTSRPVFRNNDISGLQHGPLFEMQQQAGIHLDGNSIHHNDYIFSIIESTFASGGNFVIENNRFAENMCWSNMITLNKAENVRVENNRIVRNITSEQQGTLIQVRHTKSAYLHNNQFLENYGTQVDVVYGDRATVSNNWVLDNEHLGPCSAGITAYGVDQLTVHDNILRRNGGTGSGVLAVGGGPDSIVQNNIISNNRYHGVSLGGSVEFTGNEVSGNRGGMSVDYAESALIAGNSIKGNSDPNLGGVRVWQSNNVKIVGNLIADNNSEVSAGGVYCDLSTLTLQDNLIVNNHSSNGGGVYVFNATLALENNTIVNNRAEDTGGGLYNFSVESSVFVKDCIFWGNEAGRLKEASQIGGNLGAVTVSYSAVEEGWPGEGNLDTDPLFIAPGSDYRFSRGSPCIDTGDPASAPSGTDLAGNPHLLDGDLNYFMQVDMGAYEFDNVHLEITGDATPGGTLTLQTSGTPSLLVLLFFSTQPGEQLLSPYGSLFVGAPFQSFPFALIPDTTDITLPGDAPVGMEIWVQELAGVDLPSGAGNFSNPVKLVIE